MGSMYIVLFGTPLMPRNLSHRAKLYSYLASGKELVGGGGGGVRPVIIGGDSTQLLLVLQLEALILLL